MHGQRVQRICVFAGSSAGARPDYALAAQALGRELARRSLGLVYGGGSVGLMGHVADAALAAGGEVIGVIPRGLFRREAAHAGLTALHEVASMHERKALMADLCDAVVVLPGGFGTFDEFFESLTWAQIGLHAKPIGLLDSAGYFDPLLTLVRHSVREGFVPSAHAELLLHATTPASLLDLITTAPLRDPLPKWDVLPPQP